MSSGEKERQKNQNGCPGSKGKGNQILNGTRRAETMSHKKEAKLLEKKNFHTNKAN